jgi:dUTP pyrophosphatase
MERENKKPVLKFLKLDKDATLPSYAHEDDAAFDICSIESGIIKPRDVRIFRTGLASEIPPGWFVSFRGRGGVSSKGIDVLAGVVDAGYRGEWQVVLANVGKRTYKVLKGEKIAEGVLHQVPQARIIEVKRLKDSRRGEKGFGSTGRK